MIHSFFDLKTLQHNDYKKVSLLML